mgnify:CR=1 FL=1
MSQIILSVVTLLIWIVIGIMVYNSNKKYKNKTEREDLIIQNKALKGDFMIAYGMVIWFCVVNIIEAVIR